MLTFLERRHMGRIKNKPSYSLDEARRLVALREVKLGNRARKFLREHYLAEGPTLVVTEIFKAMCERHFYKSEELQFKPGVFADIYKGMIYDDTEWYVKFFIDEDEQEHLEIWTMVWDGATH